MSIHEIFLEDGLICTVFDGDGSSFRKNFANVWRRIPECARFVVKEILQQSDCRIELPDHMKCDGDMRPYGQVDVWYNGRGEAAELTLRFHAESFSALPDTCAQWVIAHELAHVYDKRESQGPLGHECFREQRADATAEKWGFSRFYLNVFDDLLNRGAPVDEARLKVRQLEDELLQKHSVTEP